jgi:general secretion pathway protein F
MQPMSPPGDRLPATKAGWGLARPKAAIARLDEEQFARDMGLMLRSGLSIMDSIRTLRERANPGTARSLDAIGTRLTQGETLSSAMQGTGAFGTAMLACVRASEVTGDLPDTLARFADNAARLRQLKSRLTSALVYPVVLVIVAAVVVVFLLVFVVPRFAAVLEGAGRDLPAMSRMLIVVGRALGDISATSWMLFGLFMGWVAWELLQQWRDKRLLGALLNASSRLPGIRDVVSSYAHSQFVRSAAMLVRAGVPVLKALAMCRELLINADRVRLDRAIAASTAGAPLASTLHEQQLVDTLGLRVLRVAEQTGELDVALDRLADVHDQFLERTLDRVGRLVEPILMLGIGLVVGGIVVLMYLPIFQLAAAF